jgi:hypothetical protein
LPAPAVVGLTHTGLLVATIAPSAERASKRWMPGRSILASAIVTTPPTDAGTSRHGSPSSRTW